MSMIESALAAHGVAPDETRRFLAALGCRSAVVERDFNEGRETIVKARHGGELHAYGRHDIRMLAGRA